MTTKIKILGEPPKELVRLGEAEKALSVARAEVLVLRNRVEMLNRERKRTDKIMGAYVKYADEKAKEGDLEAEKLLKWTVKALEEGLKAMGVKNVEGHINQVGSVGEAKGQGTTEATSSGS